MQIRKLKIMNIILLVGVCFYCNPKSESGIDSNLWPIIQNSIENQQKCQLPNAANSNSAQCFQQSSVSILYNLNTSSLIPVGTTAISAGAKLQCKCPSGSINSNVWYMESDSTKQPVLIKTVPTSYYPNDPKILEGYNVGDTIYCSLNTTLCSISDYIYQKIRIVP
ncbi:hypothetical protein A1343_15945 [Leptospira interrogans serovar Bataviae]|nr:hypothetical protein [Leptospira interrogans serovar Bataviae]OAM86123.1 hypothetical protein A1343_15945 [Leptospira interrogans serovar Bataviae]QOI40480.1 hypothetical protein Lepto1548_19745 [Leptospira interrogans serovar Bataviae]